MNLCRIYLSGFVKENQEKKIFTIAWRRQLRGRALGALFAVFVALTIGNRSVSLAAGEIPVRIGVSVAAITYAPVFLAEAAGFFKEEGLRAELVTVPGPAGQAALLTGELVALASDSFRLYQLAAQGDTRILMVQKIIDALPLDVVVSMNWSQKTGHTKKAPLEARIKSLRGARIGTQSLGGAPQVMASFLVRQVGMNPERDVQFVALQTVPATVVGLQRGQIDAYLLSAPNSLRAEVEGFGTVLVPYSDVPDFVGLPYNSLMVTANAAKKEALTIRKIVRAIGKARLLLSSNPERSAELLGERLYQRVSPSLVLKSVESVKQAFPDRGRFEQRSIQRNADLAIEAGYLKTKVSLKEGVHWTNEFVE